MTGILRSAGEMAVLFRFICIRRMLVESFRLQSFLCCYNRRTTREGGRSRLKSIVNQSLAFKPLGGRSRQVCLTGRLHFIPAQIAGPDNLLTSKEVTREI